MEIKLDYYRVTNQINKLQENSSLLANMASKKLTAMLDDLSLSWQGEASAVYKSRCEMLKDNMLKAATDMEKTAMSINSRAHSIRDADIRYE